MLIIKGRFQVLLCFLNCEAIARLPFCSEGVCKLVGPPAKLL
jgi:hypothetical protein